MAFGLRKEFREVIESGTLLRHGTDRSRNRQTSLAGAQTMSNAKVRGIVHLIEDTKTFGQKGFRKRMIVLEQQNGRFANYIPLEFTNDACDLADDLRLGDEIDVTYRLSGRKWQKDPSSEVKYFLSAEAMAFTKAGAAGPKDGFDPEDINNEFSQAGADDDAPF
jgi:hypothetical protein